MDINQVPFTSARWVAMIFMSYRKEVILPGDAYNNGESSGDLLSMLNLDVAGSSLKISRWAKIGSYTWKLNGVNLTKLVRWWNVDNVSRMRDPLNIHDMK